MKHYDLPNIRKLFVPDRGYTIFDVDLAGADAQVVAWEADDDDLKRAFRAGEKIHEKNARDIYGPLYDAAEGARDKKGTPKGRMYDACKRRVHATNYGASAFTLARHPDIGGSVEENQRFQDTWFRLHPGIVGWHSRSQRLLESGRTITNRFGYRIIYFDRIDGLLPQALAWLPQSTVAEVCFRGALQLEERCPYVEILLNVHDSIIFQIPTGRVCESTLYEMRSALAVPIPYDDPLTIQWGFSMSEVSWGDCQEVKI